MNGIGFINEGTIEEVFKQVLAETKCTATVK